MRGRTWLVLLLTPGAVKSADIKAGAPYIP
jgi:hypothetical protein